MLSSCWRAVAIWRRSSQWNPPRCAPSSCEFMLAIAALYGHQKGYFDVRS